MADTLKPSLPALTATMRKMLRFAKARAQNNYGPGGMPKVKNTPKPITLRRADYDKERGKSTRALETSRQFGKTARNGKLAALHMLKHHQGLSDDLYRDKLEKITGLRSAADCTDAQLDQAIAAFHVKQNTNRPYTAHARALWIALYNLGAMTDGTDAALDAFVLRQSGKARLSFLTPADNAAVTEALKAMCAREGFVVPAADKGGLGARQALLEAQWKRLSSLGETQVATPDGLSGYVSRKYLTCHGSTVNMTRDQLDDCARAFGAWIRKAQRTQPKVAQR